MTEVSLDSGDRLQDKAGCVTFDAPGFSTSAATLNDAFGVGRHTVEVFVQASSQAASRAAGLADVGVSAIKEFEKALGRPLLDRHHWPVHVRYLFFARIV